MLSFLVGILVGIPVGALCAWGLVGLLLFRAMRTAVAKVLEG